MVWLPHRRDRQTPDPASPSSDPQISAKIEASSQPAFRESTPRAFVVRLAVMFVLALIIPGFHLRSLAVLSGAAGLVVAYGAACARDHLDAPCFTAWDEAVTFLGIAWLAFRLF